jgi:hypothetical protein
MEHCPAGQDIIATLSWYLIVHYCVKIFFLWSLSRSTWFQYTPSCHIGLYLRSIFILTQPGIYTSPKSFFPSRFPIKILFACLMCSTSLVHLIYIYLTNLIGAGIATGYGLEDGGVGVWVPVGSRIFSSPRRPDRLCGPPNLLDNGYRGLFLGFLAAGAWSWQLASS